MNMSDLLYQETARDDTGSVNSHATQPRQSVHVGPLASRLCLKGSQVLDVDGRERVVLDCYLLSD